MGISSGPFNGNISQVDVMRGAGRWARGTTVTQQIGWDAYGNPRYISTTVAPPPPRQQVQSSDGTWVPVDSPLGRLAMGDGNPQTRWTGGFSAAAQNPPPRAPSSSFFPDVDTFSTRPAAPATPPPSLSPQQLAAWSSATAAINPNLRQWFGSGPTTPPAALARLTPAQLADVQFTANPYANGGTGALEVWSTDGSPLLLGSIPRP